MAILYEKKNQIKQKTKKKQQILDIGQKLNE